MPETTTPARSRRPKENGGKFRVVAGQHIEDGPPECICENCLRDQDYVDGKRARARTHVYKTGDIVTSEYDLEKRFNEQTKDGRNIPAFQKFERVGPGSRHAPQPVPLAELPTQVLAAVALEEEIDLSGCKTKDDMVRRIEETRASRAGGKAEPAKPPPARQK